MLNLTFGMFHKPESSLDNIKIFTLSSSVDVVSSILHFELRPTPDERASPVIIKREAGDAQQAKNWLYPTH